MTEKGFRTYVGPKIRTRKHPHAEVILHLPDDLNGMVESEMGVLTGF